MLAALIICVADCMILLIGLTSGMVRVYKESGYLQEKIKRVEENRRIFCNGKLHRKYWASCQKVKLKLGVSNCLEELTPLKCVDKALQLTVNLLLVDE